MGPRKRKQQRPLVKAGRGAEEAPGLDGHPVTEVQPDVSTSSQRSSASSGSSAGWSRTCKRILLIHLALKAVLIFLWAYPSPIDPVSFRYSNDSFPKLIGPLALNDHLQRGEKLFENEIMGPEALVLSKDGSIYSGLGDGRIIKIASDLSTFTTITRTGIKSDVCGTVSAAAEERCGRPLGMAFNSRNEEELYVLDSSLGLLKVNVKTQSKEILVSSKTSPVPVKFLNDIIELPNGSLLISDSSLKYSRYDNHMEGLEGAPNGQLLMYNPGDSSLHVVVPGLHFPNGLCAVGDGESALLAETTRARILRYYFAGPKAGSIEIFSDNLLGWPDNISPSSNGGYWVGTALVRSTISNYLTDNFVFLRSFMAKFHLVPVLRKLKLIPAHGLVLELDKEGKVVRSLHDKGEKLTDSTSHILQIDNSLIIGSFHAPFLIKARLDT